MVMTDPIADFLTRIRNANQAKHEVLEVPDGFRFHGEPGSGEISRASVSRVAESVCCKRPLMSERRKKL